ncbi:MAG: 3-dehydroquinate synthase family protein [Saprospiraceae bacterium]
MPQVFSLPDYSIHLGPLAATLPEWLHQRDYSRVFVVCDAHTREFCLPLLGPLFPATANPGGVTLPAGEIFKTLGTCEQVWQAMLEAQLDRRALVINLGGGVVGDLGGFCAATWKRGVDFIQIPTTLLSMTDAAIGGKLGVDFQGIKNTIGVFRNPAAVFVDPAFLQTLPERELRSGFAEVVKHAFIGDPVLFQNIQHLPHLEEAPWAKILGASIAIKARVVAEDPLEKGLRMVLNYGHTIGHAVES